MINGFACGVFDLFHAGHVLMLKECRAHCDHLIVAINKAENLPPEKNKPVYSAEERKLILESCRYVDEVVLYNSEEELLQILKSMPVNIRFLGEDYRSKPITGADLGIPIHFINRDHGFSSSSIIQRIKK